MFADAPGLLDYSCRTLNYHETVKPIHIIDGDTVILADNRHVRLIGINTPEIGYDGKASQAGAIHARNFLKQLLNAFKTVHLVYDKEHHDRYQRTLAHLFLPDGTNIQAELLRHGMAIPLTIPPNLTFLDCYQESARSARDQRRGLWALPEYETMPVNRIPYQESGYRIISGKVLRIDESSSAIWINLASDITLQIVRDDLVYFNNIDLRKLDRKNIQVRGWLHHHKHGRRMRIRHPVDLVVLPDDKRN